MRTCCKILLFFSPSYTSRKPASAKLSTKSITGMAQYLFSSFFFIFFNDVIIKSMKPLTENMTKIKHRINNEKKKINKYFVSRSKYGSLN